MTLKEFLSTLAADRITASIYDAGGTSLIAEIKASTYDSLDDAVEQRKILGWSITGSTSIKIVLSEATAEPAADTGKTDSGSTQPTSPSTGDTGSGEQKDSGTEDTSGSSDTTG